MSVFYRLTASPQSFADADLVHITETYEIGVRREKCLIASAGARIPGTPAPLPHPKKCNLFALKNSCIHAMRYVQCLPWNPIMQDQSDGNGNGNGSRMTCLMWAALSAVVFVVIMYFIFLHNLPH